MNRARVIAAAVRFVKERHGNDGTGHDWWHVQRVWNNARLICRGENADRFIVDLAALLHDVGDRKVIQREEDDYSIAESFLKRARLPAPVSARVLFIIRHMSFSNSFQKADGPPPIEFQIVQDADRLDAMGAIGIARAFAYGGSKGRPLYDPGQKAETVRTKQAYQRLNHSSLHHFEEKLFRLRGLMNTGAARKIATQRHRYMKQYVREFLAEWNGRK